MLDDVIGEEEGTIVLKCEVSKAMVSPVWRKDGTVLSANKHYELQHNGMRLGLTIHGITSTDAGEYSCDIGTDITKSNVSVRGNLTKPNHRHIITYNFNFKSHQI